MDLNSIPGDFGGACRFLETGNDWLTGGRFPQGTDLLLIDTSEDTAAVATSAEYSSRVVDALHSAPPEGAGILAPVDVSIESCIRVWKNYIQILRGGDVLSKPFKAFDVIKFNELEESFNTSKGEEHRSCRTSFFREVIRSLSFDLLSLKNQDLVLRMWISSTCAAIHAKAKKRERSTAKKRAGKRADTAVFVVNSQKTREIQKSVREILTRRKIGAVTPKSAALIPRRDEILIRLQQQAKKIKEAEAADPLNAKRAANSKAQKKWRAAKREASTVKPQASKGPSLKGVKRSRKENNDRTSLARINSEEVRRSIRELKQATRASPLEIIAKLKEEIRKSYPSEEEMYEYEPIDEEKFNRLQNEYQKLLGHPREDAKGRFFRYVKKVGEFDRLTLRDQISAYRLWHSSRRHTHKQFYV